MATETFKSGDRVEFVKPIPSEDDPNIVMVVVEDRDERVLVEAKLGWRINPTSNYLKSDLKRYERINDLQVGDRVEVVAEVDRFPHFIVKPGAVGTVTEKSDDGLTVEFDAEIKGCEDWDNKVYWVEAEIFEFRKELKYIG